MHLLEPELGMFMILRFFGVSNKLCITCRLFDTPFLIDIIANDNIACKWTCPANGKQCNRADSPERNGRLYCKRKSKGIFYICVLSLYLLIIFVIIRTEKNLVFA